MLVLRKKMIYAIVASLIIMVFAVVVVTNPKTETKETVALPVNNRVIILDAGHGRRRSVGATTEDRSI